MFETKKIILNDNNVNKEFLISPLPAIPALKLVREILSLMSNTELIKSVVMQQFIHNVLQTGVKIDGLDAEEYRKMVEMDNANLIANLISSILQGLTDEKLDILLEKCLANVVYVNGSDLRNAFAALELGMIQDFTVVIGILNEVLTFNFSGALDRIKKHLDLLQVTPNPVTA